MCVCVCVSIEEPGHIHVGLLSVCVAVFILFVNHLSTSLSQNEDGQIKRNRDLKGFHFIITLFGCPRNISMFSLYVTQGPEVGKIHIYYHCPFAREIR